MMEIKCLELKNEFEGRVQLSLFFHEKAQSCELFVNRNPLHVRAAVARGLFAVQASKSICCGKLGYWKAW